MQTVDLWIYASRSPYASKYRVAVVTRNLPVIALFWLAIVFFFRRLDYSDICKMKSLLIFVAVIAATFARPHLIQEERSWPRPSLSKVPWYPDKDGDPSVAATEHLHQNVFKAGQIYLILGNNNQFLSSIDDGGEDYLQAVKTKLDVFCRFAASEIENGTVALRGFEGEGKYLQFNEGNIRPTSEVIDKSAEFIVEVSSDGPWRGAHYVYLKAENGKYWGITDSPVPNNIAAIYDSREEATRMIVLDAH